MDEVWTTYFSWDNRRLDLGHRIWELCQRDNTLDVAAELAELLRSLLVVQMCAPVVPEEECGL